jgi:hypothetical protein
VARASALVADDRLTVTDGSSVLAPLEDHLAMLLKGVQARLQSMKHRDGAIGLLSGLNQLVDNPFLPSNTLLGDRDVSLGLGKVVLLIGVVHGGSRMKTPLAKSLDLAQIHLRRMMIGV